jgi:hypothetical protein
MSKLPNYPAQEKAFLMYSAGISQADIARELKVTPVTIMTWKKLCDWDNKLAVDGSISQEVINVLDNLPAADPTDITTVLHQTVTDAIKVDKIKPKKWKDVLDTLAFLRAGTGKSAKGGDSKPSAITGIVAVDELPDIDLDKEILALGNLLKVEKTEAEIITFENGEIKTP